jgi:hypothetical protein
MGNSAPIVGSLSNIKVIMTVMHVFVKELLCQTMMKHILVLECLLSGVHGRLRIHRLMP